MFTQTKDASRQAAALLTAEGCTAAAVHSEHSADEREERMEVLRGGAGAALAAPQILDEGVDVPDADLGIVMASNRSRRQMIQRLGRVLRKRPDKIARFVVLYAEYSVEDPDAAGHKSDFYDLCLPWALEEGHFDLGADELPALLRFLGVQPTAQTSESMQTLNAAAADTTPVTTEAESTPASGNAPRVADRPAPSIDARLVGDQLEITIGRSAKAPTHSEETSTTAAPLRPTEYSAYPVESTTPRAETADDEEVDLPPTAPTRTPLPTTEGTARFLEPPPTLLQMPDDEHGNTANGYWTAAQQVPLLTAQEETHLARSIEAGLYAAHLLERDDSDPDRACWSGWPNSAATPGSG